MKYIMFKRKGIVVPVIFPDFVTHHEIKLEGWEPISAGFISEADLEAKNSFNLCYGDSESLNLKTHVNDCDHLFNFINFGNSLLLISSTNYD